MRLKDLLREDESYWGDHKAPSAQDGSPLHDITKNGTYPADVYGPNGFRYYADNGDPSDRASFATVMSCRNRPNSPVMLYRAVPKDPTIRGVNRGDWVAVARSYAVAHGRANLNDNFKVIKKQVFVRDLFTDGNSLNEWGYDPQPFDAVQDARKRQERAEKIAAMSPEERLHHWTRQASFMGPDERAAYIASKMSSEQDT